MFIGHLDVFYEVPVQVSCCFSVGLSFKDWFLGVLFIFCLCAHWQLHVLQISSPALGLAFSFIQHFSCWHSLSVFSFKVDAFLFLFKKSFPIPRSRRYSHLLYPINFIAVPFTLTSYSPPRIDFCVYARQQPRVYFFPVWVNSWKDHLSPIALQSHICPKSSVSICLFLVSLLCSIGLLSIFVPKTVLITVGQRFYEL